MATGSGESWTRIVRSWSRSVIRCNSIDPLTDFDVRGVRGRELLEHMRCVTVEDARSAGRALLEGPAALASVGAKLALAA